MSTTMDTVSAITKEIYGPRIVDQMENTDVLTKRIEKTSRGITSEAGGKYVTFPLKVRRNHGIGYRNELEQLQAAGKQGWESVRVPLHFGYGRVHMSGQTMDLVNENYQAFSSAMTEEMEGLQTDLRKDTNRIMWGDGTGVLTTVATGATDTTIEVDDLHWLDVDARIDVLNAAGDTVKASNRTVTAYDDSTNEIDVDGAAFTFVAGDIIVRTGNYGREPQGMTSLVSASGELFNLDPADEPKWKSYEDNTGGALSESRMIATCDQLKQKGGAPSVIFTDLGTRRAYFQLLTTQRRFTDTKTFEGGFKGLAFSYDDEIPVVVDVDAPAGKMWFIRENDFKIYRRRPWYWEDKDGNVWKWVVNYDAFEALMKQYWEFAIERRNTQAVMTGITPG